MSWLKEIIGMRGSSGEMTAIPDEILKRVQEELGARGSGNMSKVWDNLLKTHDEMANTPANVFKAKPMGVNELIDHFIKNTSDPKILADLEAIKNNPRKLGDVIEHMGKKLPDFANLVP